MNPVKLTSGLYRLCNQHVAVFADGRMMRVTMDSNKNPAAPGVTPAVVDQQRELRRVMALTRVLLETDGALVRARGYIATTRATSTSHQQDTLHAIDQQLTRNALKFLA